MQIRYCGTNYAPGLFRVPKHKTEVCQAAEQKTVRLLGLQADDRFALLLNTADMNLIPQTNVPADLVLPSNLGGIFASGPARMLARKSNRCTATVIMQTSAPRICEARG